MQCYDIIAERRRPQQFTKPKKTCFVGFFMAARWRADARDDSRVTGGLGGTGALGTCSVHITLETIKFVAKKKF